MNEVTLKKYSVYVFAVFEVFVGIIFLKSIYYEYWLVVFLCGLSMASYLYMVYNYIKGK